MSHNAYCSVVLDRPVTEVWDVVRDFNSYPVWVNGVDESHIEHGLSGTAVGGVRSFAMGEARTRQRLVAHSDADRFFTYEGCDPVEVDVAGTVRTMQHYRATIALRPIIEGDRCFVEWSSEYECADEDAGYWAEWWATMLPTWLHSLRDHVSGQPRNPFGVRDVPDPDGEDITAFAGGVRLTGSADDDNAQAWDGVAAEAPARRAGTAGIGSSAGT